MNLELKIPPPIVLAAVVFGMWLIAKTGPLVSVPGEAIVGVSLITAGVALIIAMGSGFYLTSAE